VIERIRVTLKNNPHARRRVLLYVLLCLPLAILFSCLPGFHPDDYVSEHYNIPGDSWVHTGSYFAISFVGFLLLSFDKRWVFGNFAMLLLISILLEFIQIYIPERGFSWLDILSNVAGIAICVIMAQAYYLLKDYQK